MSLPNKIDFYNALSEFLVQHNKLNQADLIRIERLMEQIKLGFLPALLMKEQAGGDGLPDLLIRLNICSDKDVAQAVTEISDIPLARSEDYNLLPSLELDISIRFFKEHKLAIVENTEHKVIVATIDPTKTFALQALEMALDKPVEMRVGILSEINEAIEKQFGAGKSGMDRLVDEIPEEGASQHDIEQLKDMASEAPIVRIVNLIMQKAIELKASDIHIEPFEHRLIVRLRVDGVLKNLDAPPVTSTAAVISRIKIMAKLNIAERRLPQDGRIKSQIQGQEIDMRVSTLPTMYGESVVIRLLNKQSIVLDFDKLGFSTQPLKHFTEALDLPHGIVLITGPTGSGKTTTLYTALNRLNNAERKIITVEDPIEYQLEGINQVQAQTKIGLDFPAALRSIVRQDPDVIMIGEMRDKETAAIAIQSALTGHLVLSTLHTNDATGGVTRLLDMGLEDYLLTSTLNAILAQRLVRRLCPYCRRPHPIDDEMITRLGLRRFQPSGEILFCEPIGCEKCANIGYQGRVMIVELLTMTEEIRSLIMKGADAAALHKKAIEEGMISIYDDGLLKVLTGVTTFAEVVRVSSEK